MVTVLDVNDNYPQFENSPYDVNVSEVSRREVTIFFRFNHFKNVFSFYIKSIFLCDCLNRKMSDETLILGLICASSYNSCSLSKDN